MHDLSTPSPWVVRFADHVPEGAEVLDVACGSGRHGRYFLARGHDVTFVDIDLTGVSDLAGQPQAELIEVDLESGNSWPLEARVFGGVIVVNYLYRALFPNLVAAVQPGGVLIYDTFAKGNEAFGAPRRAAFLLEPGELTDAVDRALEVVAYAHGRVDEPAPAMRQQICAQRPV